MLTFVTIYDTRQLGFSNKLIDFVLRLDTIVMGCSFNLQLIVNNKTAAIAMDYDLHFSEVNYNLFALFELKSVIFTCISYMAGQTPFESPIYGSDRPLIERLFCTSPHSRLKLTFKGSTLNDFHLNVKQIKRLEHL
jgi:hypothetical protein